jgi:epoxide hydrolase-like predicted phosphatase
MCAGQDANGTGDDQYSGGPTGRTAVAIKAVVFDIGGVLEHVEDDAWPEVWLGRWERRVHLPVGHVAAALAEHEPTDDVATGKTSEAQMRERYARLLGLDDDQAQLMMAEMWDAYCGKLDRQMRDFAAGLRPAYATAILSNSADGARREEQRRFGFEELVDVVVYSHEVGLAKPDPAIFDLTGKLLGVEPHEIVFLDDHYAHVEAARACEWHAVLHRDTTRSIQEISEILRDA